MKRTPQQCSRHTLRTIDKRRSDVPIVSGVKRGSRQRLDEILRCTDQKEEAKFCAEQVRSHDSRPKGV